MAERLVRHALRQAPRSTPRSWARSNCDRLPIARLLHHSAIRLQPAQEQEPEPDSRRPRNPAESMESYRSPPGKPFLSYTTGALIILASASFLGYRLFIYSPVSDVDPLDARSFVARRLALKQAISPTLSVFNLSAGRGDGADDLWTQGIWSVEFKQPELQISRAYTPLPPVKLLEESEGAWNNRAKSMRFLIRQEPRGEMSSYVHGLTQGAKVEVRGPHPELVLPQDIQEVVFLAGGTGIAPAMQVAYALSRRAAAGAAGSPGRPLSVSILWATRTRDDTGGSGAFADRYASIPGQLAAMESDPRTGDRFRLRTRFFVDDEQTFIQTADVRDALVQRPVVGPASPSGRKIVLVSGPEGFVAHVAGAKDVRDGVEQQGPLGGLLARLPRGALSDWQVWKL